MATLTTRISDIDFPFSGNTTQTTTISWVLPSVPVGSTITTCSLTGTVLVSMNKGSLGSVTVGGVAVTPGNSFTVDLEANNTINSVIVAVKGGNKNASGTIKLGGLTYKVIYTEPAITYTVTFVDWDGTVLKTEEVGSGSSATAPTSPARDGYRFIGWDKNFTNVTSNLTVTAQYEQIITYTVIFVDYDGTVLKTQTVEPGSSATAPSNPSRTGYRFIGWDRAFNNIISNLTVIAQYVAVYTVTFVDYNGTVLKTEEVLEGESATAPEVNRVGYTFTGWSVDFTKVTSDITTIAQYNRSDILKIKENGNWNNIGKVYKRISGNWVKQSNDSLNTLFNTNIKYKIGKPNPVAIVYSDGTMIFQDNNTVDSSHGDAVKTYTGWDINEYISYSTVPWGHHRINNININTIISPKSMRYWFYDFSDLVSLDLSNFDTSNVTSMYCTFMLLRGLTSLDVSNFNTSNVTDMRSMFQACSGLTSLDLSSFDMSGVTTTSSMFHGCTNLQTIYVKDEIAKTKIESSTNFPSTATVIIGKPN